MTTTADPATHAAPQRGLDPHAKMIFIGLMLGMLVAAVSQTIVSPAMPIIVSELGGIEHYSWLATAAMLVSAVAVPIVGKLSDLYGRRGFYIAGLVIFMVGSILSGMAQNFWWLVGARAVQGLGMGALMPLSQIIIGDIIPPRQRGKYQGYMGSVFGVTSIAGPLAGGWVTDNWGWRWLFYAGLPFGLVALTFIVKYLHLPHERRKATIDIGGITTLTVGVGTPAHPDSAARRAMVASCCRMSVHRNSRSYRSDAASTSLERRAGSDSSATQASAKVRAESASNSSRPDLTPSPSAPIVVDTTGIRWANASRIFTRVPPPMRNGTATMSAWASTLSMRGPSPVTTTPGSRSQCCR